LNLFYEVARITDFTVYDFQTVLTLHLRNQVRRSADLSVNNSALIMPLHRTNKITSRSTDFSRRDIPNRHIIRLSANNSVYGRSEPVLSCASSRRTPRSIYS